MQVGTFVEEQGAKRQRRPSVRLGDIGEHPPYWHRITLWQSRPNPNPSPSPSPSPNHNRNRNRRRPDPNPRPRPKPTHNPNPRSSLSPNPNPKPSASPNPRPKLSHNPRPTPRIRPNPRPSISCNSNPRPSLNPNPKPSPSPSPSSLSPNPRTSLNPSPSSSPSLNCNPDHRPRSSLSPNPNPDPNPSPSPSLNPKPNPNPNPNPSPGPSSVLRWKDPGRRVWQCGDVEEQGRVHPFTARNWKRRRRVLDPINTHQGADRFEGEKMEDDDREGSANGAGGGAGEGGNEEETAGGQKSVFFYTQVGSRPMQDLDGNMGDPGEPLSRDTGKNLEVVKPTQGALIDGVIGWLHRLGLDKYYPLFAAHEVDSDALPLLTLEDLREMGIDAVGPRRKLFSAIQQLARTLLNPTESY